MPNPQQDPMLHYKQILGPNEHRLKFKNINMCQLKKCLFDMKSTNSSTKDYISVKAIKSAQN